MIFIIIFFSLLCLALSIFVIIAHWRVYEKAGQPGWACIIPIYNIYIMTKIAGKPWWWLLLMLIPGLNIIFIVWLTNMISKSFGKDEGFTIGLLLLGIIFWPILGYGDAVYLGPYGDPAAFQARQNQQFDFDKNKPQ